MKKIMFSLSIVVLVFGLEACAGKNPLARTITVPGGGESSNVSGARQRDQIDLADRNAERAFEYANANPHANVTLDGDEVVIEGTPNANTPRLQHGLLVNKSGIKLNFRIMNSANQIEWQDTLADQESVEIYLVPGNYRVIATGDSKTRNWPRPVDNIPADNFYLNGERWDWLHVEVP